MADAARLAADRSRPGVGRRRAVRRGARPQRRRRRRQDDDAGVRLEGRHAMARSTASPATRGTSRGRRAGRAAAARRRSPPGWCRSRLGTDGGGSIRIPCGFCGLPGIKPTYGRVPAWPASPFGVLAHVGPMARTVRDVGAPARRPRRARPARLDRAGARGDAVPRRPRRWRARACASPSARALGYAGVDPEVAAIVARAAARLEDLGAHVEEVDPGFPDPRGRSRRCGSPARGASSRDLGDPPRADVLDPGLVRTAARRAPDHGDGVPRGRCRRATRSACA